jgi:hypothetical protein
MWKVAEVRWGGPRDPPAQCSPGGVDLEAVMNLLRNGLLMRKTGDRRRTELTETFAFLCGFSAEFITRSKRCADVKGASSNEATVTKIS